MARNQLVSTDIGSFKIDRRMIMLLVLAGLALSSWRFLAEYPQHNPWAPLDLNDPPGWATARKLSALKESPEVCRSVLERSQIAFTALEPAEAADAACSRPDRTALDEFPFSGNNPATTCTIAAGLQLWMEKTVQPTADDIFDSAVISVQHLGTYSCRRLYGADGGPWSEHATGNAIDISGFILADGTKINLLNDWNGESEKTLFLRAIRDGACSSFGTVLSPDYNAAHRDHFHFDQANRSWSVCR
ncbi:extensin-like domain-containing protein [Pontixanthobacter gangjinensis]|uniref:Extensin n=1 Tax=Pontixanthobacter gangjinensis TaxID=1028742 RepID=A0A6I4SMJ0_9SPHN|nr:extensin family protein [Pontixanthobacter gangjinensis]MXO57121.1 extensin [Pontixanthobacter gangjinensis]